MAEQNLTTGRKVLQAKTACIVQEMMVYDKPAQFFQPLHGNCFDNLNRMLAQGHYVNLEENIDNLKGQDLLIRLEWGGDRQLFSISPEIVFQVSNPRGERLQPLLAIE